MGKDSRDLTFADDYIITMLQNICEELDIDYEKLYSDCMRYHE